jgi:hypothetical protein
MDFEKKLSNQIKELEDFVKKQNLNISNYMAEIQNNIDLIDNAEIKAKLSVIASEAMKGNISNVQNMAKILYNDVEKLNKQ